MCEGVAYAVRQHNWVAQPLENCAFELRTVWKQIGHSRSCTRLASDCNIRVQTSDRIKPLTLIARRVPYVRLPCAVGQSAQFPSPHSSRRDAADAIIKRRRRPLRRYSWSDCTTSPKYGNTESLFSGIERHSQN